MGQNGHKLGCFLGMEISTYPTQQDSVLATPSFTGNQQQTTGGFGHLTTGTYARYYLLLSWDTYECWIRRMVCQPMVCWFLGYVLSQKIRPGKRLEKFSTTLVTYCYPLLTDGVLVYKCKPSWGIQDSSRVQMPQFVQLVDSRPPATATVSKLRPALRVTLGKMQLTWIF